MNVYVSVSVCIPNMSAAYSDDDDDYYDQQLHHDSTVLIVMSFVMTYKIYYKSVEVLKSHRICKMQTRWKKVCTTATIEVS